ncbi:MAG: PilT/PilU family type 4a pilus ATPase [Candidatus Kaiserbacteria bacterium]|nr:PilT/PilU family type 4a pilus ATPase [Candidatus Kaiserbacteria bacterium]
MEPRKELQDYVDLLVARSASDIHLVVGSKPIMREKRELVPIIQKEVITGDDTAALFRILCGTSVERDEDVLRESKHLLFGYQHEIEGGRKVNFRITAYMERQHIAIAMRLVQETETTIEELGLPPILKSIMQEPDGLFLITGPSGNGKSTTLTAMISHCNNTMRKHIVTIEDPIEFIYQDKKSIISQREVPIDVETFRSGIDTALRSDADIIMIGEMREIDTMRAAMTAAEVGHLTLSTVSSSGAANTVHRIIDSFPADQQPQIISQLASSLLGVCSIRLLPRITGGLIPVCEVLINTPAVGNLIRENRITSIKTAIQTGREEGMISLEQSLADLVKGGEVALETATVHANDEQELMKYL